MKKKKGDKDRSQSPLSGPFHNPFGALDKLRDAVAPDAAAAAAGPAAPAARPPKPGPARAVVRLERAGRRGKEVTVIEHLELRGAELESWLKALKQGLGCGGAIEEQNIVLQGDQRERLPALLEKRGVQKVTVGT